MLSAIKKLFSTPEGDSGLSPEETRRLAAACLLIEVSKADFEQGAEEERAMAELLQSTLNIDNAMINELLSEAHTAADAATSLYEFTRAINDNYSYEDKVALIEMMWRVAFADAALDKYEEQLIRRVASLIYLNHEDFIRSKTAARPKPY